MPARPSPLLAIVALTAILTAALTPRAMAQDARPTAPAGPEAAVTVARLGPALLATPAPGAGGGAALAHRLPLPGVGEVELQLRAYSPIAPGARFVVADRGGQRAATFDPSSVRFWRGTVTGVPGSHAVVSIAEGSVVGRIELGPGRPTFGIAGGDHATPDWGVTLDSGEVAIFRARPAAATFTAPTLCGGAHADAPPPHHLGILPVGPAGGAAIGTAGLRDGPPSADAGTLAPTAGGPPVRGLRRATLAVDADSALFSLFGDERAALTYLVQVYGLVGDITLRDVGVRLDLVFVRVFTGPDDPYLPTGATFPFAIPSDAWADINQLLSGRKDASAGGAALVCGDRSWVAYAIGRFGDPTTANALNQDIRIAAHEVGHNLGTRHTHDLGVDTCDDPFTDPRRGTLMSYCSQTFSGGSALTDMYFHTATRARIAGCVSRTLDADCNQNFINDADDIDAGRSADANANGIPDECEDCNANGQLDDADIASGASADANANGIPDECEPDCNANGIPDDLDIADGISTDANGDAIPDECQGDCDANGVFDWVDIFEDIDRDIDRDGLLDDCQDCDGDGVRDIDAIDRANNIWAVSSGDAMVKEYHFTSGVLRAQAAQDLLDDPTDLLVTDDARVLVASTGDGRVVELNRRGAFLRDLVPARDANVTSPIALAITPDGRLLVADHDTDAILAYDAASGDPLGPLVRPGAGGLDRPHGLAIGPDGALFVTTHEGRVLQYDADTGAFRRVFIDRNGGLDHPRGIIFIPDRRAGDGGWRCLVADGASNAIIEFDASTGGRVGQFSNGDFRGRLRDPWGLRLGPDGHVYVSSANLHHPAAPPTGELHLTRPHIFQYDGRTGDLIFAYVQGVESALDHPKGFDFLPPGNDRNANGLPDSCEGGCPADCDGSGRVDAFDLLCFQNRFDAGDPAADLDGDGTLTIFDFLAFQRAFDAGCPGP